MMNAQIPLPSFDDIQKILQFWIDQQDKWFYFEAANIQSGATGESEAPNPLHTHTRTSWATRNEVNQYIQIRIVGRIHEVIWHPPSLLLGEASVFTVSLAYQWQIITDLISTEKRNKYGLVFSQITYYEPIENVRSFLDSDARVAFATSD